MNKFIVEFGTVWYSESCMQSMCRMSRARIPRWSAGATTETFPNSFEGSRSPSSPPPPAFPWGPDSGPSGALLLHRAFCQSALFFSTLRWRRTDGRTNERTGEQPAECSLATQRSKDSCSRKCLAQEIQKSHPRPPLPHVPRVTPFVLCFLIAC